MGSIQVEEEAEAKTVYVAVGKNIDKSQQLLHWATRNFPSKQICVLHVHLDSFANKNHSGDEPRYDVVNTFENQKVHELLDLYAATLALAGVQAHKLLIEMDSIVKGIVEAITQHNIRQLVIGSAADKYNLGKLVELEFETSILVHKQAFLPCSIWFICNGSLIRSRVIGKHTSKIETAPPILVLNSNTEAKQSENFKFESIPNSFKYLDSDNVEEIENVSSHSSAHSERSFNSVVDSLKSTDSLSDEEEKDESEEASIINGRLEKIVRDSKSMKQKEFVETIKEWKVEKNILEDEALRSRSAKVLNGRKEFEQQLTREKEEVQKMKNQRDEMMNELQTVQDQNSALKNKIFESQSTATELEEKILSAVDLLISFREQREKLRIDYANVARQVQVLREYRKACNTSSYSIEFPAFSFMEINEATNDFDPSWKIGEGRYGSVYKGMLRNMHVAIKMLPSYGCQSQTEFENQVEVLSRVRHRNLVTLMGSCAESRSLVYEYLNNGSLEDHLTRKDKTPLPWQTRISIAADICSALIFLHSSDPWITHGNLKPSKVLLDTNFVAKLCDVGIPAIVRQSADVADTRIMHNSTNESLAYVDPEYRVTGKFTPESDLYSFGIISLQLLTGRPVLGLVRDVECALETGKLNAVLDFSAGEWPLHQTKRLANLALRSCSRTWLNRPDLVSEIWSVLQPFRTICINVPPCMTSKKLRRAPSHFVCPILQEVMEDPYIAADGFTYEAEAIREWLDSGHNTSPMTNLPLEHTDLVPNYALHNAILEWQQLQ